MFRNHLTIAVRNLLRSKLYSILNIGGLTLALSCSTFIVLYVENELSFDRFHRDAESIYRVAKDFVNEDGTRVPDATTPPALAPILRHELSEVQGSTRLFPNRGRLYLIQYADKRFYETNLIRVDTNFFDVFDFPFVSGNKRESLKDIHSILMTETTAKKYFGDEDPINKVVRMNLNNGTDFVVTGILKDVPHNSHFTFDVLIPFESSRNPDTNWTWSGFYTYVRLKPGSEPTHFESNVKQLYQKHNPNSTNEYFVQAMTDIHLKSRLKWELSVNGDFLNVIIMMAIGGFIILIATINYVNLVTARSVKRAKEVGVRKVTGASRLLLVRQFLTESMLMALVSLAFSVILTSLSLPYTKSLLHYDFAPLMSESGQSQLLLPGLTLMMGILAGLYPALYMSSFQPMHVLKSRFLMRPGGFHLRQGLVVFQFVISTGLMIGSLIIISQLNFIKQKRLGFDKENILLLPNVRGGIGNGNDPGNMIEELKAIPAVTRIARADGILGYNNSTNGISAPVTNTHVVLNFIRADYEFLPTLNIKLKEGRNFSEDFASDAGALILNETAIKQLGLKPPYLGQQLAWDDEPGKAHNVNLIGVVEDFHFGSFRESIRPFGFILEVGNGSTFFLKLESDDIDHTLAMVNQIWTKHYPERPFEYSFQDQEFSKLHQSEVRFKKLFTLFTLLALLIACLGMFGLVTYLAEAKTKEIGIRKVLGASVDGIVMLLSKDFMKMVIIALAISSPLAYLLMEQWLQGFAYRIAIDWKVFAVTALVSIVIALITVTFQSVKAAKANPVISLRSE